MALLKAFRGRRDRMTLEIKAEFDPDELKDEITTCFDCTEKYCENCLGAFERIRYLRSKL